MRELELKLSVSEPFEIPRSELAPDGDVALVDLPDQDLEATYYDTSDLRLARNGVTMRRRTGESDEAVWTVKLPVGDLDATTREELWFKGGDAIPATARRLVVGFTRGATLGPVATLRTKRKRVLMTGPHDNPLAEIADDDVSVLEGGRTITRYRELEVEARGLEADGLRSIATKLEKAGAHPSDPTPKVVRALGPPALDPPDVPEPGPLSPTDPAGDVVKAGIAASVRRLIRNDPWARLEDDEGVHQMRVAARRIRSDLRTFADLVDPEWSASLVTELKWIADVLGGARDFDVLAARLATAGERLDPPPVPLFDALEVRRSRARRALKEALAGRRYIRLLEALVDAANRPRLTDVAQAKSEAVIPPLVEEAWKKLAKKARALHPTDSNEDFHAVRIKAKRARYAAEVAARCLDSSRGKKAARFALRAAGIQDILGEHQDAVTAQGFIAAVTSEITDDPAFTLNAGRLIERQDLAAREARSEYFAAWKRFDRKKNVKWVKN